MKLVDDLCRQLEEFLREKRFHHLGRFAQKMTTDVFPCEAEETARYSSMIFNLNEGILQNKLIPRAL